MNEGVPILQNFLEYVKSNFYNAFIKGSVFEPREPKPLTTSVKNADSVKNTDPYLGDIDWDNTMVGQFINHAENSDSVGFDRKTRRWYAPTSRKFDPNQFGMGVDRNQTEDFARYLKRDSTGREYLTEDDERKLRYYKLNQAHESAKHRYDHARKITNNSNPIPEQNLALTMSAVYNLGRTRTANTIFENKNAMHALFQNDNSYMPYVHAEYNKDGKKDRIYKEKSFLLK